MNEKQLRRLALEWLLIGGAVWRVARATLEARLQAQGAEVSGLQVHVLKLLEYEGAQTLSDMSRKIALDPSTLVPTLYALGRKGLIVRQRDQQDRRRVNITLSDKGNLFVRELDALKEDDPIYRSLEQMGVESASQLVNLMRQLMHNLPEGAQALTGIDQYLCSFQSGQADASQASTDSQDSQSD